MDSVTLHYMINHVFSPPKLPQEDDDPDKTREHAFCDYTYKTAKAYLRASSVAHEFRWVPILKMLENMTISHRSPELSIKNFQSSIAEMQPGETFTLLIRAQNAGIIMRKSENTTLFESFEVSPQPGVVMAAKGKLLCSYPGPVVAVPNTIIADSTFSHELSSFLVQMNKDILDSSPTTRKARSDHLEERDTAHPRYITELLTGILRGMGEAVEVTRIRKRIGDDVLWKNAFKPWRRSSLWLLTRVALQTSLHCETTQDKEYKVFLTFMMATMVRLAVEYELESDLVFCMRAKVSRRLHKLGSTAPKYVLHYVHETGEKVENLLQKRWSQLQKPKGLSPQWAPEELDMVKDTHLSLSNSQDYLSEVLQTKNSLCSSDAFQADHSPRSRSFHDFSALMSQGLSKAFTVNSHISLADFELTVQNGLDSWIDQNIHNSSACTTISSCIDQYYDVASISYNPNPEDSSLMLLTVFDLWVGLDKLAVAQCPLLKEYSPEIPLGLLDPLLLRRSKSFDRLRTIQQYVAGRHRSSIQGMSVFTDDMSANSFAVRYFETSNDHQSLLLRIQGDAERQRNQKIQELSTLNGEHKTLMSEAQSLDHNYVINNWGWEVHSPGCRRCSLGNWASNLRIQVHEWPLPNDQLEAKATVFELRLPTAFRLWRITTFKVLRDICNKSQRGSVNPHVTLVNYQPLAMYHDQTSRITIASTTKSFLKTHYSSQRIPSTTSDVCVNNGLRYRLFDIDQNMWAAEQPFTSCSVVRYCTLQLPPDGPYKSLQYAVDGTSHTSNQWLNIAREFPARFLSFRSDAVHTLLAQTAWQVGPLDLGGKREWHVELHSASFGLILLAEFTDLLLNVEANWQEAVAVRTIIVLTTRLLASAIDQEVEQEAYKILRKARDVTFGWMHQLAEKLQSNDDPTTVSEFQQRVCEIAATCRGTFDVDPKHIGPLLNSSEDMAVLVECGIVVHDNTPPNLSNEQLDLRRQLDRDRRLSHSLEPFLRELIPKKRRGLDRAVRAIWPGYRPGDKWNHLNRPNDRWVTTRTLSEDGQISQSVQLNLLDGCLLINGNPIGRLPRSIVKDPLYLRHFGQKILDIVPADALGMKFMARSLVSNHQVFFGFRDIGNALVIRAKYGAESLELIPHTKFLGDLPTLLVENHTHWLNLSNGRIEIRPIENQWTSLPDDNWWIHFSPSSHSKMRKNSSLSLIDVRSATMRMISARMEPLEYSEYLTVTYSSRRGGSLSVHLPRFRLSFLLNGNDELESQNMPGMLIDKDQSSGTMFGLSSQLVLREQSPEDSPSSSSRRVLIPHGTVGFTRDGDHVRVIIDTKSHTQVRYHEYYIDTDLGRLVGNSSLTSRLYKSYLHAVTSHCLPDPLMGHTGTEEALQELGSAGTLSFQTLGKEETAILTQISALTPDRTFYPEHLQVMQTVSWSDLAPTAQHHGFHTRAQFIMEHAKRLGVFTGKSPPDYDAIASPKHKRAHLLERASCRNVMFLSQEAAGLQPSTSEDDIHASRDLSMNKDPQIEGIVATFSAMVHEWPSRLATAPQLFTTLKAWEQISGPNQNISLHYSRNWLKPDLAQIWLSLCNLCLNGSRANARYQLAFSLSALAYTSPESRDLIPTILAFATVPRFSNFHPPSWTSYDLSDGFQPSKDKLNDIIRRSAIQFEHSPDASLPSRPEESTAALWKRRRSSFNTRLDSQSKELSNYFYDQWPCCEPSSPSDSSRNSHPWLFNITGMLTQLRAEFSKWYRNKELQDHIGHVQVMLDSSRLRNGVGQIRVPVYTFAPCSTGPRSPPPPIVKGSLFRRGAPEIFQAPISLETPQRLRKYQKPTDTSTLKSLLQEFKQSKTSIFHRQYGHDLDKSRQSLNDDPQSTHFPDRDPYPLEIFAEHRNHHTQYFDNTLECIIQTLSPSNIVEEVMYTAGQWPRLTTRSLLGKLAFDSSSSIELPDTWRQVLIALAQSLLGLQRSRRLLRLACIQNYEELYKELENKGYDAEAGLQYPDWLLIQIESNILIRPVQIQVAQEMITPTSKQNTAFQLNMGEGKSSVIVPMVAAVLSRGHKLVRVVALKSLATQMFQLLVRRLGGLLNRRIFYLPFSRTTLTTEQVHGIQELNVECMRVGGVLLAQPEHILSFKLMGIDRLLCAVSPPERRVAQALFETQKWLEENSRDILDESDELLYVRYQLVYTIGQQQTLEGHPDRWTTIQQVFSLVYKHASRIQQKFPHGIELQQISEGSYPGIRITQAPAGEKLISLVSVDIINGELANCSFHLLPLNIRTIALRFITKILVPDKEVRLLGKHCDTTGDWNMLLLLRGLLAHKILLYVLKERRWRVDFGLDLSRSLLAVPYKAKDVPSLRAEFGHPDVSIALTCLSYYNEGLSQNQLDLCFELLDKLDNPTLEYESWVNNQSVPEFLRHLSGVNTNDPEQRRNYLFPLFHCNHVVIDFFLSRVVFPKEAKTFSQKLATSGWDPAEIKQHVTTGFSGTNDRRYILPISIIQDDPIGQLSTNARVLTYLLQPENNHYSSSNKHLTADEFLQVLVGQSPEIRVLLDVGAQVLELQNAELATHWLSLRPDISAVIFFGDNDELSVLTHDGTVEAFISSPFNQQLDKCLVYLDDAHTRGTDLKLPRQYRAAVTLGPKVTKDRLLQGCMRMRKLGHGQSVMFFAPFEIDRDIRQGAGKAAVDKVNTIDILRWAMLETCKDIEHHVSHWALQGVDYHTRQKAWSDFSPSSDSSVEELASSWLQPEARSLESMYGLASPPEANSTSYSHIPEIYARCQELGVRHFSDTRMDEEQEREVHHEVETEREVQRPPRTAAAEHQVHPDVRKLVVSGRLPLNSPAFVSVFLPLARFAAASQDKWSPNLLATRDFSTTIHGPIDTADDYLRPVNWIVSCGDHFIILSPFEVNYLLPRIRANKAVRLHLYTPRVTRAMKSFDDLDFYSVPPLPRSWTGPTPDVKLQLNLWAGQLYLEDRETYLDLCHFLGLYTEDLMEEDDILIQNDAFIKPEHRHGVLSDSPFTESPVPFLKEITGLRRKGMDFSLTPLGKILHAKFLTDEDFD